MRSKLICAAKYPISVCSMYEPHPEVLHYSTLNAVEICKWYNVRFPPGTTTYAIVEALVDAVQETDMFESVSFITLLIWFVRMQVYAKIKIIAIKANSCKQAVRN